MRGPLTSCPAHRVQPDSLAPEVRLASLISRGHRASRDHPALAETFQLSARPISLPRLLASPVIYLDLASRSVHQDHQDHRVPVENFLSKVLRNSSRLSMRYLVDSPRSRRGPGQNPRRDLSTSRHYRPVPAT